MTNRKLIERLAHTLSVHHALLLAQGVLLQRLRVSKQEYADAVKKCRPARCSLQIENPRQLS